LASIGGGIALQSDAAVGLLIGDTTHMTRRFVTWTSMKNEHGTGSWAVIDGILTVRTAHGTKSAQIGGMPPEYLARVLMRELFYEQRPDVAQ